MAVDSLDTEVGAEVVDGVVDTVDVVAAVYVGVVLVVVVVVVVVHSVGVGLAASPAASATAAVGSVLAATMVVAVIMSAAVGAPAAEAAVRSAAVRSASYPMGAGMPLVRRYLLLLATENPHCIWMMASEDVWIRRYCYPRIERIRRWLALLHHLMLEAY